MNNVLDEAESLLRRHSYSTQRKTSDPDLLVFEDEVILGLVAEFPTPLDLLEKWAALQESFLKEHSEALRTDPTKAWNLYSVLLTRETALPEVLSRLRELEEDFNGTRKICRAEIQTNGDLEDCLGPLLLLQSITAIVAGDLNSRLRAQLLEEDSALVSLLSEDPPAKVAATLLERQ